MGKSNISQKDAYKLMLKEYPDIMTVEQMCEVLGISTKTGYRLLREKKICCLKVGRAYSEGTSFYIFMYRRRRNIYLMKNTAWIFLRSSEVLL